MNFVKKWIGCIVSFVAGVCGLALSACPGMVVKGTIDLSALGMGTNSVKEVTKGFKVLTDSSLYTDAKAAGIGTEFLWMKAFAIVTLIASILLIAYAIVVLLKNINVIKCNSKVFDIVGISLIALLLVATIGLMITSTNYADCAVKIVEANVVAMGVPSQYLTAVGIKVNATVGTYQIAMLIISIISAVLVSAFTFVNRKKA